LDNLLKQSHKGIPKYRIFAQMHYPLEKVKEAKI